MKYKISLSNKESIFVTKEEYKKILEKINNKFIIIKGELFNTAFLISITKEYSNIPDDPKELLENGEVVELIEEKPITEEQRLNAVKRIGEIRKELVDKLNTKQ